MFGEYEGLEKIEILQKQGDVIIMKATGIVRKVDQLGRIVLPIDLRREFDLKIKDDVEIFTEGATIILKKYVPACVFCGEVDNVNDFKGKIVCKGCLGGMKG